jgi:branched-chain amino acid transport system ATP-binding protein
MLTVENLSVNYGPIRAVRGVSFAVPEGQIVTLVGANGAGKTTIMHTISGLLRPAGGRIVFAGQEITRRPAHRIVAAGIGQVAEGRAILAGMTVEENLALGTTPRRPGPDVARDIAAQYERFPVLGERRRQLAGTLSGGEQQMLAIARALVARPRLLLLDEPSMGLAPLLVREIFRIIRELNAEGRTILLVEQNAFKALAVAHYAYVLERGQIVLEGPGPDLLRNPQVERAYLGGHVEQSVVSSQQSVVSSQ